MRKRGIDAFEFLIMVTFGLAGMQHPSLAAMIDCVKARMSREALHMRFSEKAVVFMQKCVGSLLHTKLQKACCISSSLLNHFKNIYIIDSSSWDVAPGLSNIFPGSGGSASAAGCKIQLCYEYLRGVVSYFELGPSNCPDNSWSKKLPQLIKAGDLLITDLGYFCLRTFQGIAENKAYFLSRFLSTAGLLDPRAHTPIDLYKFLNSKSQDQISLNVVLGGAQARYSVTCRLVCLRVCDEIAKARRERLMKTVLKKRKKMPSKENLYLCSWTLMVTNVPDECLNANVMYPLYSMRWQIELIFKQFKSVLAIHKTNSAKEPRVRCEILGRLIVAIIAHRIHANLNIHCWNTEGTEISIEKLYKRVQERASTVSTKLLEAPKRAEKFLKNELLACIRNLKKCKQKARLTTLERIHLAYEMLGGGSDHALAA